MQILLVTPSFPKRVMGYLALPSLELCILSSLLKNAGHRVSMFDMKINRITADTAEAALRAMDTRPDIVLIDDSPETHCTTVRLIPMMKAVWGPGTLVAARGELPSFIPGSVMERNPALDFVCRYDDDYAFPAVVEKVSRGQDDFESVRNIAFRRDGRVILSREERRPGYALDDLPMPDRRLYDVDKYLARDSETIVRSSRGCPGNCLFCIKTRFECFRLFSIPRFCDEIESLQQMGFQSFFFSDDTFAFSDRRLAEFAAEVERRNMKIRFTSNLRISDINEYKAETLKRIGAYRVFVGIETVNAASSGLLNKRMEEDYVLERLALLKKHGLEFHASFILGAPNDTPEDLAHTMAFVRKAQPTVVTYNLLKVYPGLPLYEHPERYHIRMADPYWYEKDEGADHCVMGTDELPPAELEKWARRMMWDFIEGKADA